jgi:hypothetical protein
MDAIKGINVLDYDLSIAEKTSKLLEKTDTKIKAAENGKYYLQKGNYTLTVNLMSKSQSVPIQIK